MRTIKSMAIALIVMLIATGFLPVVQAASSTSHAPINQTVTVRYDPDPSVNWTTMMNAANATDDYLSNYNQTIAPFLANNKDIQGIIVAPYFTPVVLNKTVDHKDISLAQYFKVRPEIVMDGVSDAWIKIPVLNIPDNATIRVRVGRIDTNQNVMNMSYTAFGSPSFTTQVAKVYDITNSSITNYKDFRRDQSNRFNATTNFYWNFTWVHCSFALMPNEWYVMLMDISYPGNPAGHVSLAVSQDDLWADSIYKSWVWVNGTNYWLPGDLDMDMILTTGIASGMTGLATDTFRDNSTGARLHYNSSIPFGQVLSLQYLEFVLPVFFAHNDKTLCNLTVQVLLYTSTDDSALLYSRTIMQNITMTINPLMIDCDVLSHAGASVDHIRLDISVWANNTRDFKLWAYQYYKSGSNFLTDQGFTNIYFKSATKGQTNVTKAYFIPFGSITQSDSRWAWTDKPLLLIPIETPNSTANITLAIKNFEVYLSIYNIIHTIQADTIGALVTAANMLMLGIGLWAYNTFGKVIEPFVKWFIDAFIAASDPARGNLFGIAIWLFKFLTLAVDALQYMAYFMVRAFYAFSLIIVYIVNLYGVISINAALLAYATTGRMADFTRSFRAGWKFVYGIIALLLSLIILAVSILGAVIPL